MLTAISPVDGRYGSKCDVLRPIFSEFGLIASRVKVEIEWLIHISSAKWAPHMLLPELCSSQVESLRSIYLTFSIENAQEVKIIEQTTNHDVKAVEYYIRKVITTLHDVSHLSEHVHFCCTSEDINNLSYSLMLSTYHSTILRPYLSRIRTAFAIIASATASHPLLSLTHGQPATPTTFGKEIGIFTARLDSQILKINSQEFRGKFNGASGNFNAHSVAFPGIPWEEVAREFVTGLGVTYQPFSSQIECHDYISEMADNVARTNSILMDACRDMWLYISRGVLKLKVVEGEVGSSTMPHKVNPIDFENAEGNIGIANALLTHFSQKLPVSRLQRDLTDSTVLRCLGMAAGHTLVAHESILKGLSKIDVNSVACDRELGENWAILTEAVQTVMRKHKIANAYETMKDVTRGREFDQVAYFELVKKISDKIGIKDTERLFALSPSTYLGIAPILASKAAEGL